MSASEEHVLWSHYDDSTSAARPRSLLVGAALLAVALAGAVGGIRSPGLDGFFGLALIAGTGLVLFHLLKSRRREILRLWTDPSRPGVVLMRRSDGVVQTLNPVRVRRIGLVRTSGAYLDEPPGELPKWHSYALARVTLRAGLTWYTTRDQSMPGPGDAGREQPSWPETHRRLAATFPNARISERHVHLSAQEGFD